MAESERLELPENVKDIGIAIGSVLIVFLLTFAYSGNWPPMVVIESGSMEHDNNPLYSEPRYSHIGIIDTGDLVIVKQAEKKDIVTYLEGKKTELEEITEETQKEEEKVLGGRQKAIKAMEEKLEKAYNKIRANVRNGVAVAPVLRGACGGCFAKIPPQLQSDIRQRKKIVICEHCGRINVDAKMAGIEEEIVEEKPKSRRRRKVAS